MAGPGAVVNLNGGSTANLGYGAAVAVSADGGAYTAIAQSANISGPGAKVKPVGVTNNDSPSRAMEKIPGLIDGGSFKVNIIHTKAAYLALTALLGLLKFWKITWADGGVMTCQGFITDLDEGAPAEDAQTDDLTVELTGKPTWA